uniref:C2H2-type domain-containing protein n=1 Tax=Amphiprion percula TaxID=161767 RepID=A0A3P8TCS6_AMPPE
MLEKALMKLGEHGLSLGTPDTPLVTDFTIVTGSDIVTPVEPVADGLVYGLTLPATSLTPSATLTPVALQPPAVSTEQPTTKDEEDPDSSIPEISSKTSPSPEKAEEEEPSNDTPTDVQQQTFTKNFVCNVCDKLFHSMKELGHHVGDHADEWPYKCEFCVLLFGKPSALLDHRSSLHGVGKTYVCSACTKEFVYLCNLKQHQEELHPGQQCTGWQVAIIFSMHLHFFLSVVCGLLVSALSACCLCACATATLI